MAKALNSTDFQLPFPAEKYSGKVRDTYDVGGQLLILVATDRISAFDNILPRAIPHKGQVLNQTAAWCMERTKDICPNHVLSVPDPNVTIGLMCKPFPVEMVVRGYLAGHAWRVYREGGREVCGNILPDGLKENDKLPEPIITPTTKSKIGHDEDITEADIIKSGLVEDEYYQQMRAFSLALFQRGTELAAKRNLILVDTKYEFGWRTDNRVYLIDEVHTPDSSRYFYADTYAALLAADKPQRQLSKEFVREWLMERGYMGQEGQEMPEMDEEFVNRITSRYVELYEQLTGEQFIPADTSDIEARILGNLDTAFAQMDLK